MLPGVAQSLVASIHKAGSLVAGVDTHSNVEHAGRRMK